MEDGGMSAKRPLTRLERWRPSITRMHVTRMTYATFAGVRRPYVQLWHVLDDVHRRSCSPALLVIPATFSLLVYHSSVRPIILEAYLEDNTMPVGVEAWVTQIPPITRAWLGLAVLMSLAVVSLLLLFSKSLCKQYVCSTANPNGDAAAAVFQLQDGVHECAGERLQSTTLLSFDGPKAMEGLYHLLLLWDDIA